MTTTELYVLLWKRLEVLNFPKDEPLPQSFLLDLANEITLEAELLVEDC